MKKFIYTILLLPFLTLHPSAQEKTVGLTDEEYTLVSSVIDGSPVIQNKTIPAKIFINEKPTTWSDGYIKLERLKDFLPELSDETVKDFNSKNEKEYKLERKFKINDEYVLSSVEAINKFFENTTDLKESWDNFRKAYPKSRNYVKFSRFGFSPDGKQALIYFTKYCGSLCAEGNYIFFVKENDKWIVKREAMDWIS